MDHLEEYMKKKNIPVTRENFIGLNFMGDVDPKEQLPAELETSLPKQLQIDTKGTE